MGLLPLPKGLREQSEFYHQLGSCLSAGISLPQAITHLSHHPPARALRRLAEELGENLERGATFAEAAVQVTKPLSEFDLALIEAGERSGRLDECLGLLAQVYREKATLLGQALSQLTYPVLILHVAVFITPLPALVLSGNVTRYLMQTLGLLLPGYALVLLVVLAINSRRGEEWRAVIERVGGVIPVLGSARRDMALSRLAMALGALLNAGVSVVSAWNLAASACGSPAIRRAVNGWRGELDRGMTSPGELANRSPEFPQLFATSLLTGEASGKLDDSLARLRRYYAEEGSRKMSLVATMAPRLFYLGVLLLIARQILQTYSGYQDQLNSVLGP